MPARVGRVAQPGRPFRASAGRSAQRLGNPLPGRVRRGLGRSVILIPIADARPDTTVIEMNARFALVVMLSQLAACPLFFGNGGGGGPSGVEMGGDFELDPSCMLDDAIDVELGDGSEGF